MAALRQAHKIRYTTDEWSIIVDRARQCGRPPARYAREVSLGATPRGQRHRENGDMIHELGRIGTTLARLVAASPQEGDRSQRPMLEAVLTELLATVRRLG